jgi:hypothetical protein
MNYQNNPSAPFTTWSMQLTSANAIRRKNSRS